MHINSSLRSFAHNHDELPAFHVGYIVLVFIIVGLLNAGVFALLIIAHMALDTVKYRERHGFGWKLTVEGILRENLFDCALLAASLLFSVYLHPSVILLGLSGIARTELTLVRAAGTILPRMEIFEHFLWILLHMRTYFAHPHLRLQRGLGIAEMVSLVVLLMTVPLLLLAPFILHMESSTVKEVLLLEMIPWKI
ncbi:MAG: hypothetical protein V1926_03990 [Candidatus Peregrinibacteria bacterium]